MKLRFSLLLILSFHLQFAKAQCWKSISMGALFSAGVMEDGSLWAWGRNQKGQLGDGSNVDKLIPKQIGTQTNWAKVSCGAEFMVALKNDGTIWSWGANEEGQLGLGSTTNVNTPTQIGISNQWIDISAGARHVLALNTNGVLFSWGSNGFGQLGDGTNIYKDIPGIVPNFTEWESITAGGGHSLSVRNQGTLMSWGYGIFWQLGNGLDNNLNLPAPIDVAAWFEMKAGYYHSVSLKYSGPQQANLWAWGFNNVGELGDGTTTRRDIPVQIGTDDSWIKLGCTIKSTYGIKADNSLWAWGLNTYGQLGDGTNLNISLPLKLTGDDWQSIGTSTVSEHMIASKLDGSLWAWGKNDYGQLGDGTTNDSNIPKLIFPCNLKIEDFNEKSITIFPNPGMDWIQISGIDDLQIQELNITDIKGKTIALTMENSNTINIQHLIPGLYFIHIKSNQQTLHSKFIKQ